jgi:hypothetical protein
MSALHLFLINHYSDKLFGMLQKLFFWVLEIRLKIIVILPHILKKISQFYIVSPVFNIGSNYILSC